MNIETIFELFEHKQLAMIGGDHPVVSNTNELDTNVKMDNNIDGLASNTHKSSI